MTGFWKKCGNYYNTVLGQLSQTVIQRPEALEEYDDIQTTRDLGRLFVSLDQVVLSDRKDCAPFVNALRVLVLALTTRQPTKQSLPDKLC